MKLARLLLFLVVCYQQQAFAGDTMMVQFEKANSLLRARKTAEAIMAYEQFLQQYPQCQQAHFNLGIAYLEHKDRENARSEFKKALDCSPDHAKSYMELADIDLAENNVDQAINHFKQALMAKPDLVSAHQGLGKIYRDQNKFDLAIAEYQEALKYEPQNPELLMDYGSILSMAQKNEESLECFLRLHATRPDDMNVYYNVAYAYKRLDQFDKAIPIYKEVIEKRPDNAEARYSLGISYLTIGEWDLGWQGYEWRWQKGNMHKPHFAQPVWDGSRLDGKTLFVIAEQGLGDTFQSIRFAQVAKEQYGARRVIAAVQRPLVKLLGLCPYIDEVVELGTKPRFDTYVSTMSFPFVLQVNEETIPVQIPYLCADKTLIERWRRKLSADKNFRIGLCWQGNPNYSTNFLRTAVAIKSMTPATFEPLSKIPGVSFYSLQKDHAVNVDETVPEGFIIQKFEDDFDESNGRFMDTAAVMKNLDLIISVDTSVAHLAAALGCPTWVLLPKPADWRWLLDRQDSPWYPTMRLFRQKISGDWEGVMEEVLQALAPMVAAHAARNNK